MNCPKFNSEVLQSLMKYTLKELNFGNFGCVDSQDFVVLVKQLLSNTGCARCTGVLLGYIVALVTFMRSASYKLYIFMCIPMLIDWLVQYLKIRKSNNTRSFFTGLLCGYGVLKICLKVIFSFIRIIVKQLKY